MDPLEFLARVLIHVREPNKHLVRFYGAYANRVRSEKLAHDDPAKDEDRGNEGRPKAPGTRPSMPITRHWGKVPTNAARHTRGAPVLAELRDQVVYLEHGLNEDGPQPEKGRGGARGARERALSIDGRLRVHRRRVHQRSRIELKVFRIGIGGKRPQVRRKSAPSILPIG